MLLGSLNSNDKNVAVIGAGIAGLIASYRLLNLGYNVTLYEKESRAGGLIQTRQTEYGIAESAVHSVPGTSAVRQLFQELNVEIVECATEAKSGLIWRNAKMRKWPLKPLETACMFLRVITRRAGRSPRLLSEWARYHMGCRAVKNLITPMTIGIYGTTPERLEMPLAFPTMNIAPGKTLFQHMFGRRQNKRPPPIVPMHGMQDLSNALLQYIQSNPKAVIHFNTSIIKLPTGNVVVCVPSHPAAQLLQDQYPDMVSVLNSLHYSPLITATVFVRHKDINSLKSAFGVLFPPDEADVLGILFNSVCFAGRVNDPELCSFTFMLGGTPRPELLQFDDAVLQDIIKHALKINLGWRGGFMDCTLTRWPKAVPVYNEAIRKLQERSKKDLSLGIALFGNYTGGVALRAMIETDFYAPPITSGA